MSAILTNVSNSHDNLLIPDKNINLKNRYEFTTIIEKKSNNNTNNGAKPMDYNSFINFVTLHNKFHKNKAKNHLENKVHSCLVICQSSLGIRFDNLKDLFNNNQNNIKINKKTCVSCQSNVKNKKCKTIESECLDTIIFKNTKVKNPTKTYIIPQIYPCLSFLKNNHSDILNYNHYNNFIKNQSEDLYTTHSCRKFLANLSMKNRNTGGWTSYKTLEKNYIADHTKFAELASILSKKFDH